MPVQALQIFGCEGLGRAGGQRFAVAEQQQQMIAEAGGEIDVVQAHHERAILCIGATAKQFQQADLVAQIGELLGGDA